MKTIEKKITVNLGTLKAYGEYIDKIYIPELDAYISLIVSEEKTVNTKGRELSAKPTN